MNELDMSLSEYRQLRSIAKTQQFEMAANLVKELSSLVPDLPNDLGAMIILDALGCAGLSLTISEHASETFVSIMNGIKDEE